MDALRHRESQVFMALSLVIGALTGLAVVAFIVLTERMGMRLYPVHGRALAASPVPGRWFARHRLSALSFLPQCARQRRAPDQGRALCPRWPHHAAHRAGQVLLHLGDAGQRDSPRPRRSLRAGGRGHRLRAGTRAGPQHRAGEKPDPRRRGGGHCSRIQYSSGRRGLCPGRDYGRPQRAHDGWRGAGLRNRVDGPARISRRSSALQRARNITWSVQRSLRSMRYSAWPAEWSRRPSPGCCSACARGFCACRERRSGSSLWQAGCWWARWVGLCPRYWAWVTVLSATH